MKRKTRISSQCQRSFKPNIRKNISLRSRLVTLAHASRSTKSRRSKIAELKSNGTAATWNFDHKMNNGKVMVSWDKTITRIVITGGTK